MSGDASELDASQVVFKLVPLTEKFIPPDQKFPNWAVFDPTQRDKDDASARGTAVRLTVWDLALTEFKDANAIWGHSGDSVIYGLGAVDVWELREQCKRERLRIVRDPEGGSSHPGHCGFEGLDHLPGENRRSRKTLLDEIAQRCFEIARM
jgi:hypothetical protein